MGWLWYKEKSGKRILQFAAEAHQKDSLKAFWVDDRAGFPSQCLSAPNNGNCSFTSLQEHSMFQLLRPFIPHLRHTCSLMKVITLQGAPTSFHTWDSKQLITQSLPENIPSLALPGALNTISAKLCPHSLCSLRAQSQDSENNPLGRLLRRVAFES